MKFIIVSLLIVFAVIVGVHSAPQLTVSQNGGVDGVLAQVDVSLQPILSQELRNIVRYVIKVLANGNPLIIPLGDLQNVESQLESAAKDTLEPYGVTIPLLVGGKINNPMASLEQIYDAFAKIQPLLSTILKPRSVTTINQLINILLHGATLSNVLIYVTSLLTGGVSDVSGGLVNDLINTVVGLLGGVSGLLGNLL